MTMSTRTGNSLVQVLSELSGRGGFYAYVILRCAARQFLRKGLSMCNVKFGSSDAAADVVVWWCAGCGRCGFRAWVTRRISD